MIFEMRNDKIDEYAVLVDADSDEASIDKFFCDGKEKHWSIPPAVMPAPQRGKKKIKPRADISHFEVGALVLNQRAYAALHHLLTPFGQLLPLDCQGVIEYFYNVTHLIACIDPNNSEFDANQVVRKEAFLPGHDGNQPLIFKDPRTAGTRIYVNQVAKLAIEEIVLREQFTGMKFSAPGSWPY